MKILQLTDMHFASYPFNQKDQQTVELITTLVEREQPELVVVSGDLISGYKTAEGLIVFQAVVDVLDSLGPKIAITYGNHDSEGHRLLKELEKLKAKFNTEEEILKHIKEHASDLLCIYENHGTIEAYTRKELNKIVANMKHHVEKKGLAISHDKEMYYMDINDETRILLVDSGDYDQNGLSFYDSIDFAQQNWIVEHSLDPDKVSHLFIHIPLPEYAVAKQAGLAEGNQDEVECPADYNTGTWSKLKFQTNVQAIYCGHDHDNDYSADYHGIQLNYGRVTGYNCYGKLNRGARVVDIEGKNFQTYIVTNEIEIKAPELVFNE